RACPKLRILATSRESLGVVGETLSQVPFLSLPDPRLLPSRGREPAVPRASISPDLPSLRPAATNLPSAVLQYEAVRLFIDRAVAVSPDFAVTNENAPWVAEVCHRLEGIP